MMDMSLIRNSPRLYNLFPTMAHLKVAENIYQSEELGVGYWPNCSATRHSICVFMGIADITVKLILRDLLRKEVIYKPTRGVYKINKKTFTDAI